MLSRGVYPASVTPLDASGRLDKVSLARLLAFFEASGCRGVVLAGTNGEGPSLSAAEKRELIAATVPLAGQLEVILGIATPSLDEAQWLARQAGRAGAKALLLMAPGYFREASESGIEAWFRAVLDASPIPAIIYNFPKRTGVVLSPDLMTRLSEHPKFAGIKDSSGDRGNLAPYAAAAPGKSLFVGDETLLMDALDHGWTGTISGAANVIPRALSAVVADSGDSVREKFRLLLPTLEALRASPQPGTSKALLTRMGILSESRLALPLLPPSDCEDAWRALKTCGLGDQTVH